MSAISALSCARLTPTPIRSNLCPVAAKSATGIGVPKSRRTSAHQPMTGAFLLPAESSWAHASQFYGGRCAGAARSAGSVSRYANRAPSVTSIGVEAADSTFTESNMSHDTQAASANPRRVIAATFGAIANTLDWNHDAWLALMAKLEAAGKPAPSLTLADVTAAIDAVRGQMGVH